MFAGAALMPHEMPCRSIDDDAIFFFFFLFFLVFFSNEDG